MPSDCYQITAGWLVTSRPEAHQRLPRVFTGSGFCFALRLTVKRFGLYPAGGIPV